MKTESIKKFLLALAAVIFAACVVMLIYYHCPWWTFLVTAAYYAAISVAIVRFIAKAWLAVGSIVLLMVLSLLLCSSTRGLTEAPFVDSLLESAFSSVSRPSEQPQADAAGDDKDSAAPPLSGQKMTAPDGFELSLISLPSCGMELLTPLSGSHDHVIYQLHGGSYIDDLGSFHRENAVRIAKYSGGSDVASLDYRTAPAVSHSYILDDALAGYCTLAEAYGAENIVIIGDSAGGGLALALTMVILQEGFEPPAGVAVMCPWADLTTGVIASPFSGEDDVTSPLISPAFGDYAGFPPLLIQTGSADIIHGDSLKVRDKALADGAEVIYTEYEGMTHNFQLYYGDSTEEGGAAWEQFADFAEYCYSK